MAEEEKKSEDSAPRARAPSLREQLDAALAENAELKKQLEGAAMAEPVTGLPRYDQDFVVLGGVVHEVLKTVRADQTFDEVKKGNVDEGATLVVIAQKH